MRKGFSSVHPLLAGLIVCAWSMAIAVTASESKAQENPWKVSGKLLGKPKGPLGEKSEKSEDVSGIACATTTGFPRVCLVVDDETQGAQVVIVNDGSLIAGDFIRLIDNAHAGKLLELDAEAAAYADGSFYVIGSHGRARHEAAAAEEAKNNAKAEATRRVFRVSFDVKAVDLKQGKLGGAPDIKGSPELSKLIKAQPELAGSFDKALQDNGLTIEGVAVRGSVMYVGLRGPVLQDGNAVIVAVPLSALFDGQQGSAKPHRVALGKDTLGQPRGIRDLVIFGSGFLILAGPEHDPPAGQDIKPGDYTIFSWNETTLVKLLDLKPYGKKTKPEALLPLDQKANRLRALLLFDGPEEGEPTPVEIGLK